MERARETTERPLPAGGVESRQRVVVPQPVVERSDAGARWLGVLYWQAVNDVSRGIVRASWSDAGGRLRLLSGPVLLRFGPAELRHDEELVSCTHRIAGGLLALRAAGSVTLSQAARPDGVELTVAVEEYLPRLAARAGAPAWTGVLYARGQRPFHSLVSRRYFELLEGSRTA
jgi:hypothetical protein